MKYWKEKENNPVENMQFWTGTYITKLAENEIFLYGSNPQGINGAGAAKAAMSLSKGAKHGVGRGFNGSNAYALVTKSLNAGFLEKSTGILYDKEGYCSVSPDQIRTNIDELYEIAKSPEHKDKKFLVSYQYESWPNGTPKKSLNGYTSQEMLEMFVKDKDVPPNIVFHESYKPHLEKLYKNQNKQSNGELVVYEDGKTIDIKEEDVIWTIDSDERNPSGIHGAGGAKAAVEFGAKFGNGRGLMGQSYGLVTKNLKAGFTEKSTGITYDKDGYCSVSKEQIRTNIDELYECARQNPEKNFLITFQYETWPNGLPKKSLNGYNSEEMFQMFIRPNIPSNIVFHDSYKDRLESIFKNMANEATTENKKSIIAFTKVSLPNGWMSNMAPFPVTHEGIEYRTTEALFQALRYKNYPDIQREIIAQTNPMQAKIVAKTYKNLLIENGYELLGEQDIKNMKICIDLKLEQHPHLIEELIATGNKEIIEDCTKRPQESGLFWGSALQDGKWVGKNVLGKILMEKRLQLIEEKKLRETKNKDNQTEEKKYTFFFHLSSPFSNFHPSKFEYKGYTFISNEQFMMFSKAKNFKDENTAEKIIAINNEPLAQKFINGEISREEITKDKELSAQWQNLMMKAKKLGRSVQNYDEEVWNNRRFKIVKFGAKEKFNQNADLKKVFLATGNTQFVEVSPRDKIWGIGLSEYDAKRTPAEKWPGLNLLGKVLDEVKLEFKNELNNSNQFTIQKKSNYEIEVVNFYHLGKKIPSDGVYIGRFNKNFNLQESKFANPFAMKDNSEEERSRVVKEYKDWLWKEIADNKITKEDLLSLDGKKLVCYCSPKKCHGDVLRETVEFLIQNENDFDQKIKDYSSKKIKP